MGSQEALWAVPSKTVASWSVVGTCQFIIVNVEPVKYRLGTCFERIMVSDVLINLILNVVKRPGKVPSRIQL